MEEYGDPASDTGPPADGSDGDNSPQTAPADTKDPSADLPAADGDEQPHQPGSAEAASETTAESDSLTADAAIEALPDRKRELLEAVAEQPEATQATIADAFDVTRATVSRWASDIEGFEWRDRAAFVEDALPDQPAPGLTTDGGSAASRSTADWVSADESPDEAAEASGSGGDSAHSNQDIEASLGALEERVAALEAESSAVAGDEEAVFEDPELVHKVVHACMAAETIDEAEELRIISALLD